ncbi:MAG TPA: hypothetical protein V6C65_22730, partial [Allocoleopsis sp.]
AELRRALREKLGLKDFLNPDKEWTKYDLYSYACKAREWAAQIKQGLCLTITESMSDVQVIHQLLSQLGIKVEFRWSRSMPGHEGEKLRVYRLHLLGWQEAIVILEQRQIKRDRSSVDGSPQSLSIQKKADDPFPSFCSDLNKWGTLETLQDMKAHPCTIDTLEIQEAAVQKLDPNIAQRSSISP